ncbi:unnamed protein product, partial [Lymnaea stagnalis]
MALYNGEAKKDVNIYREGGHTFSVTSFSSAGSVVRTGNRGGQQQWHDVKINVVSSKPSDNNTTSCVFVPGTSDLNSATTVGGAKEGYQSDFDSGGSPRYNNNNKQIVYSPGFLQAQGNTYTSTPHQVRGEGENMHSGSLQHSSDHRATFVSSINVRDSKPPPIPSPMLGPGGNVGLTISTSCPAHYQSVHWQGGKAVPPLGVSLPHSPDRNVLIAGNRYPASKTTLINPTARSSSPGQSQQISVQYQTVYHHHGLPSGNGNSNYSSPRSSIGSGDSKNSSPRTSLTNPALYEQKFGSPRSSLALASPRSSWNSVTGIDSKHTSPRTSLSGPQDRILIQRVIGGLEHELLSQNHASQSIINLGLRGDHPLNDNRFNEPAPPHIYTDPRQRTLPPQAAVSVHTSTYATSVNNNNMMHQVQNGDSHAVISSPNNNSVNSSYSSSNGGPPSIPARVPLNYNGSQNSDAEKAVAALTQQLERDMSFSGSASKKSPESPGSQMEPPPPYHGPHDVQTSVKFHNQNQPQKPNVKLVAPVQGIQVQSGSLASSRNAPGVSPGLKSHLAFQVTPPKSKGPSDAERKLAALTQQLEDEMDHIAAGDYFGKLVT